MNLVERAELVEEHLGLVAVPDAKLGHVELSRQTSGGRELVPEPKQLADKVMSRFAVARVTRAAWQRLLVAAPGRLLPQLQRGPVQRVEFPYKAGAAWAPVLEKHAWVGIGEQPGGGQRLERDPAAATHVHRDLAVIGGTASRHQRPAGPLDPFLGDQDRADVDDVAEIF